MARQMPQLKGVRHRFVNTGDLKTHVAVAGEGDPVVLLHGWPEHWYAWRAVIPKLMDRYQVIVPDLRGFGWTDIAWKGFQKENMADDVLRLMDAMEIDRFRLVGHDWGGWIGFLLGLREPERLQQLVAVNIAPPWVKPSPRNLLASWRLLYQVALAVPFIGQRLLQRRPGYVRQMILKGAAGGKNFTKEDFRIYGRDLKSPTRARASGLLYRTFLLKEFPAIVAGRYRKARLEVPTLVLHGKEDPVVPRSFLWEADRNAADLRVEVVANAGHFLPEERPGVVADKVLEFFEPAAEPAAMARD